MKSVAFVTYAGAPELVADDLLVAACLRARGCVVTPARWDDATVEWPAFDAVVLRSTWDYHHRFELYTAWLRARAADGTRLWNSPAVVLANLHKGYLADFAREGIDCVPTQVLPAGVGPSLAESLARWGWHDVVVKPAVSASAHGTWRTSRATASDDEARFAAQRRDGDLLVQPYLPEITTLGEWSLIFFSGEFSHGVRKRPAAGDFRVQEQFGGASVLETPPPGLIADARKVLGRLATPLLYARVDGLEQEGRLRLMELEIHEPYLCLGLAEGAAERFAAAIEATL